MRRTPLKPGGPLRRAKGLASGAQLASTGINRKAIRRGKSERKKASDRAMAEVTPLLLARSGPSCEKCGRSTTAGHRHHRRKRGGPDRDVLSNLLYLCAECHGWVHQYPAEAKYHGWIVPPFGVGPVEVPVLYRTGYRVLLGDDGSLNGPVTT